MQQSRPDRVTSYDVVVFYDIPGVIFTGTNPPFVHYDPSEEYKSNFLALLETGKGVVFLHHTIAA